MSGIRKRIMGRDRGMTLPTHTRSREKKSNKSASRVAFFIVTITCVYFIWSWISHWQTRRMLYVPLSVPKVIGEGKDMRRFWGSYRPQVYFGMKTQSPRSLVTGMMWLQQYKTYHRDLPLRHTCEQGDRLLRYGWIAHDGLDFGIQDIMENNYMLRTEFVKSPGGNHGGDWSWRVTGRGTKENVTVSIFFYAATDQQGTISPQVRDEATGSRLYAISGRTEELGDFTIKFPKLDLKKPQKYHYTTIDVEGLHKIKDGVLRKMSAQQISFRGGGGRKVPLYSVVKDENRGVVPNAKSKVLVHQVTLETPFEVEVVFQSGSMKQRVSELSGEQFTSKLANLKLKFDQKFEARFPLYRKGYNEEEVSFAKAAFSNMIGGIGHFYGESLVQSQFEKDPVLYWSAPLLTAVPSRSFFPRGFLWDEGFHELLISKWDQELSLSVIGHWLDLINAEGWIPREQILGDEARSKVPAEFVVQRNTNANPPTLFLALQSIIEGMKTQHKGITQSDKRLLATLYPRLETWFNWFNTTQSGPEPGTYRWRGRAEDSDSELNPKTLTSGLDDYPRASHPSKEERHIDLRCWIAFAADAMVKIANEINKDGSKYQETRDYLMDNALLDKLHWSDEFDAYADYGNHTSRVFLKKQAFQPAHPGQPVVHRFVRGIGASPKMRFVNARGYISLFPFLLQILDPDSPKLTSILEEITRPDLLWTNFGLRSLSVRDPLYMQKNTEHDPPYWRGQIWININYLAVRALKHYSEVSSGQTAELAKATYEKLRTNLVRNIFEQYKRTGYIWENYNDRTGLGQGCHPFTGWSALVVLMMSEQY